MPSEFIQHYLDRLIRAVEADEREATHKAIYGLLKAYQHASPEERQILREATTGVEQTSLSETRRKELAGALDASKTTSISRNDFFISLALYLDDALSDEKLLTLARTIKDTESTYADDKDLVRSTSTGRTTETRAQLEILQATAPAEPVYPDQAFELDVRVGNLGEATSETAALAVASDGDIDISPEVMDLGTLEPDAGGVATFRLVAPAPGVYPVLLTLFERDGPGEDQTTTYVEVDDEAESVSTDTGETALEEFAPLLAELGIGGAVLGGNAVRNRQSGDESETETDEK